MRTRSLVKILVTNFGKHNTHQKTIWSSQFSDSRINFCLYKLYVHMQHAYVIISTNIDYVHITISYKINIKHQTSKHENSKKN